jgi:hypothetical protein
MKFLTAFTFALMGCVKPNPPSISQSQLAGTWDVEARVDGTEGVATKYVLTISDSVGWRIQFADGSVIRPQVLSIAGDSIVTRSGPYASTLRPGVSVVTEGVFRLRDGKMIGRSTARYNVSTADSVRRIHSIGTRR